jgi:ligand-binding sensor domain-containing protein
MLTYNLCNGQLSDPRQTDSGLGHPKSTEEMKSYLDAGIDPYFIETKDTFSTHGPQCIIRNLVQDKAGNIWLATWNGIIKYDPSAMVSERSRTTLTTGGKVFTNYTYREGLIHFHMLSLFEDSKGNIWFGTARGGVYRYNLNDGFTLFTTKEGLPDNTINCISEDAAGNIWFGTEKGVSCYKNKNFRNYTVANGLSDNHINAIIKDKNDMMWYATNKGLNVYNGASFTTFVGEDGFKFNMVVSLFEDRKGNIWIGSGARETGGKGLCRFNPITKMLTYFVTPYFVMYICEDKIGNLWLAHNEGAAKTNFTLYNYNGEDFEKVVEQSDSGNPVIFGIMEDKDGNIWFGTAKGVCRYDGKTFNYFSK